jgi:hypothetical protein
MTLTTLELDAQCFSLALMPLIAFYIKLQSHLTTINHNNIIHHQITQTRY